MKKIIAVLGLLALLAITVQAQNYSAQTIGRFVAKGSEGTNVAYVIYVPSQSTVAVQWTAKSSGANTDPQTLYFQRSVDGVTYDLPLNATLKLPSTGATVACTNCIISTLGCAYIKFPYLTNDVANTVFTTNTLKFGYKVRD